MNEHYTFKQAMERLRFTSKNAFLQVVRKYPDIFVNVNPHEYAAKEPWYDKAAIDKFAQMREHFKQEKSIKGEA